MGAAVQIIEVPASFLRLLRRMPENGAYTPIGGRSEVKVLKGSARCSQAGLEQKLRSKEPLSVVAPWNG